MPKDQYMGGWLVYVLILIGPWGFCDYINARHWNLVHSRVVWIHLPSSSLLVDPETLTADLSASAFFLSASTSRWRFSLSAFWARILAILASSSASFWLLLPGQVGSLTQFYSVGFLLSTRISEKSCFLRTTNQGLLCITCFWPCFCDLCLYVAWHNRLCPCTFEVP